MDDSIAHRLAIIEELRGPFPVGASLLDFGCGSGREVTKWRSRGFDAMGCDVGVYDPGDAACGAMYEQGILRLISLSPYRIPFDDATFDVVVSNQVFEHVQDYSPAVREVHRVLKLGGVALHTFPPRWKPLEAHVYVPFAGVWRNSFWLGVWAWLGVRNEHQLGLPADEVASLNENYLKTSTNYLSTTALRREFARFFPDVRFVEDIYLKHSPSPRAKVVHRLLAAFPPLRSAYSAFRERVIFTAKH